MMSYVFQTLRTGILVPRHLVFQCEHKICLHKHLTLFFLAELFVYADYISNGVLDCIYNIPIVA
jgi:hypothetical protein